MLLWQRLTPTTAGSQPASHLLQHIVAEAVEAEEQELAQAAGLGRGQGKLMARSLVRAVQAQGKNRNLPRPRACGEEAGEAVWQGGVCEGVCEGSASQPQVAADCAGGTSPPATACLLACRLACPRSAVT